MSLSSHLQNLQARHNKLKQIIKNSYMRFKDDTEIQNLKKQKLMIKDKIRRLMLLLRQA